LEVIDKNRIFAKIFYKNEYQPINSQDYEQTITQPQYNPEDNPDPHHPPPAAHE
jgi:hypothetical protein